MGGREFNLANSSASRPGWAELEKGIVSLWIRMEKEEASERSGGGWGGYTRWFSMNSIV